MNNVCQADLNIYTPACLPPTGTSFVGKTGTVYGKFSILELCILHYRPMFPQHRALSYLMSIGMII